MSICKPVNKIYLDIQKAFDKVLRYHFALFKLEKNFLISWYSILERKIGTMRGNFWKVISQYISYVLNVSDSEFLLLGIYLMEIIMDICFDLPSWFITV